MEGATQDGSVLSISPLRKEDSKGVLYTRPSNIEEKLFELHALSNEDLVGRCAIREFEDPSYVPSECVLHFVRNRSADKSLPYYRELYEILSWRVLSRYPDDGGTNSLIREEVFGQFVRLVAKDIEDYCERLDFFEVRFDKALVNLLLDAKRKVIRNESPLEALEEAGDEGGISAEVSGSDGGFNPFDYDSIEIADYRSLLDRAIDSLPPIQQRILEMIRHEIPIHSKDPGAVTIAGTLGKCEKTIRLQRDKAYAALRIALQDVELS